MLFCVTGYKFMLSCSSLSLHLYFSIYSHAFIVFLFLYCHFCVIGLMTYTTHPASPLPLCSSPLSCLRESVAHPKSASCRGLWEPVESPWPGVQAGSHSNAGMWGVWGDKSCEPSQGETSDGARGAGGGVQGRVRVRPKQEEQQVWMGIRNNTINSQRARQSEIQKEGHTLEMGSQPYSSLHFIYIPGRIDQSDWEQSPGLRRGIKRQNAFAALIPPW